jgi:ferredoxin
MTYVINESCIGVKDGSCVEQCPVDCIYEGEHMFYIHPDECVDCGACEPICPVDAIYYEDDLPPKSNNFLDINRDFFRKIGSPGGASGLGKLKDDPDQILELAKEMP